jgi:DNA-binding MarR family transcriptional regulator
VVNDDGLPTSEQLAVWRAYIETVEILRSRVESDLHHSSDLSSADYRVLLALVETSDGTLRSSELAAHIEWERSRLSAHLGRMERRGLVTRARALDDARGTRVALTPAGADAFHASTRPHLRAIRALFVDAFTERELERIHATTTVLRDHLGLSPSSKTRGHPGSKIGSD